MDLTPQRKKILEAEEKLRVGPVGLARLLSHPEKPTPYDTLKDWKSGRTTMPGSAWVAIELQIELERALRFIADLNGSEWIKGNGPGEIDMRQRSKALHKKLSALARHQERLNFK